MRSRCELSVDFVFVVFQAGHEDHDETQSPQRRSAALQLALSESYRDDFLQNCH